MNRPSLHQLLLAIGLLLLTASCRDTSPDNESMETAAESSVGPSAEDVAAAVETITESDMLRRIRILAHDSMGGRDTPSPGLEMAAAWAADEFASLGLEAGGDDGTYIQRYEMTPRGGTGPVLVPNVVGLRRGVDPELADEWLVFTAHFDHVSGGPDETGDAIYNGADDNASGTAAIMEIAEAFSLMEIPTRRSLAFVLVSGEEKGLLGARHFAQGTALPTQSIVADINADMVSMNWPDSIFVFGREFSSLGPTLDRTLEAHPEVNIAIMESRWPQLPLFRMSDHFAFVQEEIPSIFFFSGLHENLHRPSDHVEAVDCDKAARVARLMFHFGLDLAQAAEPPAWTEEGRKMLAGLSSQGT